MAATAQGRRIRRPAHFLRRSAMSPATWTAPLILASVMAASSPARGQEGDAELAKKLANPVASLISVPLQANYDCCYGPREGGRYVLNVQPVAPIGLNEDWNLIVRTIVPIVYQEHTVPDDNVASGLGDTTQSFFFSPAKPVAGLIVAVGPVFLWPTGSSELGSQKWGAGLTALALKQDRGFTYGLLANHIWSYADLGDEHDHPDVSSTFVQPFLSWTNPKATTVSINAEASYDWKRKEWSIPVNLSVSHVYKFGSQRVSLGGGPRVYMARNGTGPDWGVRAIATFLFPK
jgi:hypothetical protein